MTDTAVNIVLATMTGLSYLLIIRSLLGSRKSLLSIQSLGMLLMMSVAVFLIFGTPIITRVLLLNVVIIVSAVLFLREDIGSTVAAGIMTYYIVIVVDLFIGFLLISVIKMPYDVFGSDQIMWIATNLIVVIGSVMVAQMPRVKGLFSEGNLLPQNRKSAGIISAISLLLLVLQFYFFRALPAEYFGQVFQVTFLMQIIMLISFIYVIQFANRFWKSEHDLMETQRVLEKSNHHVEVVEAMLTHNRKYRHDIKNALVGLNGLIDKENEEARGYIASLLGEVNSEDMANSELDFSIIQNRVLLELLVGKVKYASEVGVPFRLAVIKEIRDLDIDMTALARVIGSLLDNAIEASMAKKQPVIFGYLEDQEEYVMTVINQLENSDISVKKLFEKGYSTKGTDRGLGLTTVREIVDTNSRLFLTTIIDHDQFIQELTVKKQA